MNPLETIGRELEQISPRLQRWLDRLWYAMMIGVVCLYAKMLYDVSERPDGIYGLFERMFSWLL